MKRDASGFLAPLVAALVLAVMLVQTRAALRASGTWTRGPSHQHVTQNDPYAELDRVLAEAVGAPSVAPVRDPFGFAQVVVAPPTHVKPHPVVVAPPPAPVLTSIIWDNDPRATVRWAGRDYSVRTNSLFADFRVASISRDQVVLERGGERTVLTLPRKGD